MDTLFGILLIVAIVVLLIAVGPLLMICGMNWLLEPLGQYIPYTWGTWFGAFLIQLTIGGSAKASSK